mmetsp:Transcript_62730/g.181807  ORF Transcript_62730/g.181807 Transcript_62730/m.181807 type:complete len:240 (-) Transcript_62730:3229-3948(-)
MAASAVPSAAAGRTATKCVAFPVKTTTRLVSPGFDTGRNSGGTCGPPVPLRARRSLRGEGAMDHEDEEWPCIAAPTSSGGSAAPTTSPDLKPRPTMKLPCSTAHKIGSPSRRLGMPPRLSTPGAKNTPVKFRNGAPATLNGAKSFKAPPASPPVWYLISGSVTCTDEGADNAAKWEPPWRPGVDNTAPIIGGPSAPPALVAPSSAAVAAVSSPRPCRATNSHCEDSGRRAAPSAPRRPP